MLSFHRFQIFTNVGCRRVSLHFSELSCHLSSVAQAPLEIPSSIGTSVTNNSNNTLKPVKVKRNTIKFPIMNIYNIFEPLRVNSKAKFDETVDIAVRLGVDPRKPNQAIKSVAKLPFGTGKKIRVAVFAFGDDAQAAIEAGADVVGADDLIKIIQGGEINFDRAIATPEMMVQVSKIGKILGPKGLMPNPKLGTVTKEIAKAVKSAKSGAVQFRCDKTGIIHAGIGKISFNNDSLFENIKAFMLAIGDAKPEGFKGQYIKTVHVSSTMGPSLPIEVSSVDPSSPKFFVDPAKLKRKI